jgi:hypothetical protein
MAGGGGSIVLGALWMFALSVLLFWLPVVGPLIAGVVGGKTAGSVGRAIAAVFLPAIAVACLLFVLGTSMTGLPLIGALAGMGGSSWWRPTWGRCSSAPSWEASSRERGGAARSRHGSVMRTSCACRTALVD